MALKYNGLSVDESMINEDFESLKTQNKQLSFNDFKALIESIK
jgi:hypothetical protein